MATSESSSTIKERRSGWIHLAVLVSYTVLTALMTWPLVRNLTTAIPGDSFDGWQNYWNLWWIKVALVERVATPYVTDLLYHPTGVELYFHTLNPFNGLLSLPIQLSAGLIPAYNFIVFFSWVMGGYGVFLLARWTLRTVRRVEDSESSNKPNRLGPQSLSYNLPSFLAGVIFTFAPFHMAHLLGHMQVMALQWIPFYVLYLLRATQHVRQQKPWLRDALLAGLFLILAALCDWYFVLYLFLFTGLVVIWYWIVDIWRWASKREESSLIATLRSLVALLLPPIVAGLVFLLVLSPILIPMMREASQFSFMVRPTTDLYIFSASLMDFLSPNRLHTWLRPESYTWIGNQIAPPSERTISIGYIVLALAIAATWLDRRRAGLWLVAGVFFLVLALGPAIHLGNITWEDIPQDLSGDQPPGWTLFALLNRIVPFMRISRSVSRYALMVQLCAAVVAAIGLGAVMRRLRQAWGVALALGCLFLVIAELWVAPYFISPPDTPPYYEQLAAIPGDGAMLNLPMNYDRPGYLLYQTVHKKPLTGGYISRDDPRTLTERVPVLQHFRHLGPDIIEVDAAALGPTVLHDLGVDTVVLDRYKMPEGLEREYTTELAQAIFAGQTPTYEDDRLTVYNVQPPAVEQPYVLLGALNWGAMRQNESDRLSRPLDDGPAQLHFRHLPASAKLRIRYRTAPGATLSVLSEAGQTLATLPSAPDGQEVVLELDALGRQAGVAVLGTLALQAQSPDSVDIETIALVPP